MTGGAPDEERFLALVDAVRGADPRLTPVQAAIVVAAEQGLAQDSRSFARKFGLAHAVVLRELNVLIDRGDRISLIKRDPRTMRTFYR